MPKHFPFCKVYECAQSIAHMHDYPYAQSQMNMNNTMNMYKRAYIDIK